MISPTPRDIAPEAYEHAPEERSELNAEPEEAPARRQPGQLVEVALEDGQRFVVHLKNRDRIAYEKVCHARKWPPAQVAKSLAMAFICWSAAKNAGQTTLKYEEWEQQLVDWDEVEDAPADPTRPTA